MPTAVRALIVRGRKRNLRTFVSAAKARAGPSKVAATLLFLGVCIAANAQETTYRLPQQRAVHFLRGRTVSGGSSPAQALDQARKQHTVLLANPRNVNLSANWTAVGPGYVINPFYGAVTGRITALALDPSDSTGNTLYLGTTGGGVWKSINAAGPASSVSFVPLTDTLPVFDLSAGSSATPSLSIGSLAVGGGILLAGTGDPNDATDSYYGGGILRSSDGGLTWTLIAGSRDGVAGNHTFVGMSVAAIAFSTLNPLIVVAALSSAAEATQVNAGDQASSIPGLYESSDGGLTWQVATVLDGSYLVASSTLPGSSATSVVWNNARQRFYGVLRDHGYYESADGLNWTRLPHQPGANIQAACGFGAAASFPCPVFRGTLAVEPVTGDTYALTTDSNNLDQGLYRDICGLSNGSCAQPEIAFGVQLNSAPIEAGAGDTTIAQGDYNAALSATHQGADTLLYVGTIDLYRCSILNGCPLRNTTNAQNGCASSAQVAGAQHTIATLGANLVFTGNDGGLWRSTDGVEQTGGVCSPTDAAHFDNLNSSIGSLAEVTSFAQDPVDPHTLIAGLGALGTAGTGAALSGNGWFQLNTGEGGTVAIDLAQPRNWYVSSGAGVNIARCTKGSACTLADFAASTLDEAQVANDTAEVHTPWLLDPSATDQLLLGTCRMWRGPVIGGSAWSATDLLSAPFAAPTANGCSSTFSVVRSIAAGGPPGLVSAAPNRGSTVLYAGLAGIDTSGATVGGHLFATNLGASAGASTRWTDLARNNVTNAPSDGGLFNPGAFDISAITVDAHDTSGSTVYATIMGFAGNGTNSPHLYRSSDAGAHWANISANLPNAPANGVVVDPNDANTIYIALDTGVYVTTSVTSCPVTNCWSVYGSTLPNSPILTLAAAPNIPTGDGRAGELRAGTYGRGIWQIPLISAIAPQAPIMSLSLASITFTAQAQGTHGAPTTVAVTNVGVAPLLISSVIASTDFSETNTCIGAPVAPASSCTVAVLFAPQAIGLRTGLLTIYANVAGGQATVSLSGTATPAATIVLTPLSLDFGPVGVGSPGPVKNITISNTAAITTALQPVTVTGDFSASANSCGPSLAPQTGCTVSITFRPTVSGVRQGLLTITDAVGTQVASLTGIGISPATDALSALTLSFPSQAIGTASVAQSVTLTNAGDVALTLISTRITGSFSVVNQCGASLAPHASCNLSVIYLPRSIGPESGILTVSDAARSQTVLLKGIGAPPLGVSLSPSSGLAFGAIGVGLLSPIQTATFSNNSALPLTVTSATASPGYLITANTCGSSLAAYSACTVQISFAPLSAGPQSGTLSFIDDSPNSPQTLALNGIGVDFTVFSDGPSALTIPSGQNATYLLLLRSATGVTGDVSFSCTGLPAATTCTISPSSPALGVPSGTVVTVTLATGVVVSTNITAPPPASNSTKSVAVLGIFALSILLHRSKHRLPPTFLCLLLLGAVGCSTVSRTIPPGGSGGGPGPNPVPTPSGTYPIVVSASSAQLIRAVTLTLTVQ